MCKICSLLKNRPLIVPTDLRGMRVTFICTFQRKIQITLVIEIISREYNIERIFRNHVASFKYKMKIII